KLDLLVGIEIIKPGRAATAGHRTIGPVQVPQIDIERLTVRIGALAGARHRIADRATIVAHPAGASSALLQPDAVAGLEDGRLVDAGPDDAAGRRPDHQHAGIVELHDTGTIR